MTPAASRGRPRIRPAVGAAALVLTVFAAGACSRTLGTTTAPPAEGSALREYLRPDSVRSRRLRPGTVHRYLWSPRGPWAVHIVEIETGRCELGFEAAPAESVGALPDEYGESSIAGRARTSSIADAADADVVAAVNADFFDLETGAPVGTEVVDGRPLHVAPRPTFGWRPDRGPWIGTVRLPGDSVLFLRWPVHREGGDGATQAVGGFPELLDGGGRVGDLEVLTRPDFAAARHPRTAVGFDPTRQLLWLVVVDGRQEGYSAGMTLPELTGLFDALGATEALNLDGGGSTALVVEGEVVSSPSDREGERPVSNALLLVRDRSLCRGIR